MEVYLVVFVDENLQLAHRNPEIRFVEAVQNVPTERPEFPTLLHQRVEEAQTVKKLLEYLQRQRGSMSVLLKRYSGSLG